MKKFVIYKPVEWCGDWRFEYYVVYWLRTSGTTITWKYGRTNLYCDKCNCELKDYGSNPKEIARTDWPDEVHYRMRVREDDGWADDNIGWCYFADDDTCAPDSDLRGWFEVYDDDYTHKWCGRDDYLDAVFWLRPKYIY